MENQKDRAALARMLMRLFDVWDLTLQEQLCLLGYSPKSLHVIRRYRDGASLTNRPGLLKRVGLLLGIHKNLRLIFPQNRDLAYRWITTSNAYFNQQRPLDLMLKGEEGMLAVYQYLESV